MTFDALQKTCRYKKTSYDIDHYVIDTCAMPGNIPKGESWNVCDPEHCPLYDEKVKSRGKFKTYYMGMSHKNGIVEFATYCSSCGKAIVNTEIGHTPNISEYRYCPFCGSENEFEDIRSPNI